MPHHPYKALYIHIPFCVKKCNYCDFCTSAINFDSSEIDDYVEQLILELRSWAHKGELNQIETIYIGGGTPSFIGTKRLTSLLYFLGITIPHFSNVEFTVEANPESLTGNFVRDMWAMGVNRLSIGIQSFDDRLLSMLGRSHDSKEAKRAIELAHERFENISIDLMCGIPGQTFAMLEKSLDTACSLDVAHISVYPLTIEPKTIFAANIARGKMEQPDDDMQADQMMFVSERLCSFGFNRYEVSSYAKPGYESKHNCSYWQGVPYLGIGISAASMTQDDSHRMRIQDGNVIDDLNRAQIEAEDLMLGMRMRSGVSLQKIEKAAQYLPSLESCLEELVELDLLLKTEDAYKPTTKGWLCGNELYERLFELA